jgi:putative oxidoreductase
MARWTIAARRWYDTYTRALTALQNPFLLLIRLYWGWQLAASGWNKLMHVEPTAQFFASLGIVWPTFNAVLSGSAECFGGLFLLVGLGSRLVAPVLIFNMTVAYVTAHTDEALALFSKPHAFVTAPPFLYLLASIIVWLFGPGIFSVDAAWGAALVRRRAPGVSTATSGAAPAGTEDAAISRRDVARLTAAAVSGLIAGALLRGLVRRNGRPATGEGPEPAGGGADQSGAAAVSLQAIDAKAPAGIQPSLLIQEPHTCCGLNTCNGLGKGGGNSCAGRGGCATAEAHACQGLNECKGQGGCGEYPGQNTCSGKGACAVPMKKKPWQIARTRFEELMALQGKEFGPAPSDCPKQAGGE